MLHIISTFLLIERFQSDYGPLVWVFVGYDNKMDKLFEHNPGLPSRFPNKFVFEDYNDDELLSIFTATMKAGGRVAEEKKKDRKTNAIVPSMQGSRYQNYNNRRIEDQVDAFGNTWQYDVITYMFLDQHGNRATNAVDLGGEYNPLMSVDNYAWYYDANKKVWYHKDPFIEQKHYPGSVPPTPIPFTASDKSLRIAMRRLGRGRGTTGFGNARSVRSFFDAVRFGFVISMYCID